MSSLWRCDWSRGELLAIVADALLKLLPRGAELLVGVGLRWRARRPDAV